MSARFYDKAFIYFIRPVGMDGPVKIGCSTLPERRLMEYHAVSPFPLEIVATLKGNIILERRFQQRFAHLRTHHEWFRTDPELTAAIQAIQAGSFDIESLPEGFQRHRRRFDRQGSAR